MHALTGTRRLIRLALRRDRIKLPIWIAAIVGLLLIMIPPLAETYATLEMRLTYQATLRTSAIGRLFAGNVDVPTFGAVVTAESMLYIGLAIAFMNVLLIVRHTRHNEELGSSELLHSAHVGRFAALTAALCLAAVANLVAAIGLALVLGGQSEISWSQAWLYGIGQGLLGMCFASIAAITAQLSGSARGASSLGAMVIGAAFLLRGVGDVLARPGADGVAQPLWPSLLSPFGWLQMVKPLVGQHVWPLLVPLLFSIVALIVAFGLLRRRDIGSGMLAARAGLPRARPALLAASPIGLAVRLQKGVFIGWLIGVAVLAGVTGGMAHEVLDFVEESEVVREYITALGGEGNFTEMFLSAMLGLVAMVAVAYIVQSMLRIRSDETRGYAESLLATALSRKRWVLSHALVVAAGGSVILLVSGLVTAASAGLAGGMQFAEWRLGSYALAGVSYAPALFLFIGLVVCAFGLMPRATLPVGWLAFTYVIFIGQLGVLLKLPRIFMNGSPFTHLPAVPASDFAWTPQFILLALGLGLLLIGLVAFRRRDLKTA